MCSESEIASNDILVSQNKFKSDVMGLEIGIGVGYPVQFELVRNKGNILLDLEK